MIQNKNYLRKEKVSEVKEHKEIALDDVKLALEVTKITFNIIRINLSLLQ